MTAPALPYFAPDALLDSSEDDAHALLAELLADARGLLSRVAATFD